MITKYIIVLKGAVVEAETLGEGQINGRHRTPSQGSRLLVGHGEPLTISEARNEITEAIVPRRSF